MWSSRHYVKHVSNFDHTLKQSYRNDYNDHIAKQMIIRTCIQWNTIAKGCIYVQHTNTMQWEQQSINTKHNSKHHKANKKIKQNKVFLITQCILPLGICISPMEYLSLYKCAWEIEFLSLRMCTWVNRNDKTLRYTL